MKSAETEYVMLEMNENDILKVLQIQTACGLSDWSFYNYKKEIERRDAVKLVVKYENTVIGFLLTRLITLTYSLDSHSELKSNGISETSERTFGEAEIYNIAIEKTHRRQGAGKMLLKRLIEICRESSVNSIWLEARESNSEAIEFYTRNGFERRQIRKDYYSSPVENAVVMQLSLV